MRRGTEIPRVQKLIVMLEKASKKNRAKIWKYVAELIKRPRRKKVEVNLYKIERISKDGDTIIVPGKVLGIGKLDKNITLAALSYSKGALKNINKDKVKIIDIEELIKENPKGSNIRIII